MFDMIGVNFIPIEVFLYLNPNQIFNATSLYLLLCAHKQSVIRNLPLLCSFLFFTPLMATNDDCEFIGCAVNSELTSIPKDHYMFLRTNWVHGNRVVYLPVGFGWLSANATESRVSN